MVTILVNRPATSSTMTVITDTGERLSMSATPPTFDYTSTATVGSIDRVGKKSLSRTVSPGTASQSFQNTVAALDWHQSIAPQLAALLALGNAGRTVRFTGASTLEQGNWWIITGMSASILQRNPQNEPTRAKISWQLKEAVDVNGAMFSSNPRPAPPAPLRGDTTQTGGQTSAPAPAPPAVRTHTVVPGDTLWHISARYLGDGARWPEIWEMNRGIIANPNLIYVGQVFRIPG